MEEEKRKNEQIERCINFVEDEEGNFKIQNDNEVQVLLNYLNLKTVKKLNNSQEYYLQLLENEIENELMVKSKDFKNYLNKKNEINENKEDNNKIINVSNNSFINSYSKSLAFNINIKIDKNKNIFQSGETFEFFTSLFFKTFISTLLKKKIKNIKSNVELSLNELKDINNFNQNEQFNNINKLEFDLLVNEIESQALKYLLVYFRYNLAMECINNESLFNENINKFIKPKYNLLFEIALDLINQSKSKFLQIKNHLRIIQFFNQNQSINIKLFDNNNEIIYFLVTDGNYIDFYNGFISKNNNDKYIKEIIKLLEESKIRYFIIYINNIFNINKEDLIIENIKFKKNKNEKESQFFERLELFENENKLNVYLCKQLDIFIKKINGLFSNPENNFTKLIINNMYEFYKTKKQKIYEIIVDIIKKNKEKIKNILEKLEDKIQNKEEMNLSDELKKNDNQNLENLEINITSKSDFQKEQINKNINQLNIKNKEDKKKYYLLIIGNKVIDKDQHEKITKSLNDFNIIDINLDEYINSENELVLDKKKMSELLKDKIVIGILIYFDEMDIVSALNLYKLIPFDSIDYPYFIDYNSDDNNYFQDFLNNNKKYRKNYICPIKDFNKIYTLLNKNIIIKKYKSLIVPKIKKVKKDLLCHKNIITILSEILKIILDDEKDNNNYFNIIYDDYISFVNEMIAKYIETIKKEITKIKNQLNNDMLNKTALIEKINGINFNEIIKKNLCEEKLNDLIFYNFYEYFVDLFFPELIDHFLEIYLD